jgi:hypothetical protein
LGSDDAVELIGWRMEPRVARRVARSTAGNPPVLARARQLSPRSPEIRASRTRGPHPCGPQPRRDLHGQALATLGRSANGSRALSADEGLELALLSEAAASLDILIDSLDEARRAGLLTPHRGDAVFAHPLVRSTVYRTAGPDEL